MIAQRKYSLDLTIFMPYERAIGRVKEALKSEGFGILTEIDVKETLKTKIDVDVAPYMILGACNPNLAHRALSIEPEIGVLLPCNVVVQECRPGRSRVMVMDPMAALGLVDREEITAIATEARERLERAVNSLAGQDSMGESRVRPVRSFSTLNI